MKKNLIIMLMVPLAMQGQSLEECQKAAERNYPLIRQYDLIERTTELTVENIQKGWLPQVSAQAQATYQSDVTAWPEEMQTMMNGMGVNIAGLRKDQYRVGIDVQQTVYDGGRIRSQKEVVRQQGAVQAAQNEVSLYGVRKRVNEMYFGLLLLDEQIRLNADLQGLLEGNEKKLRSMFEHGTAAESDYMAVRAERLNARQQGESLQRQRQSLAKVLATFCGIEGEIQVNNAELFAEAHQTKAVLMQNDLNNNTERPELKAIDAQLKLADAQEKALDAALLPRLSVFASGFYGYPGYNMFEDMMSHKWSLNGMVGARLTWNIGALYSRRNDKAKIQLQRDMAETSRRVFLFNNNIEQTQQTASIERYRAMMKDDEEIISLRSSVRKAAESKLEHGIIDVNDLMKEITAENSAKVQHSVHGIEMLKEIYDLRYTRNF